MTDDPSDKPTEASDGDPRAGNVPRADDRIDRYRLLRPIGEGGMGEVWLAEQVEPVQRRVAVKIIKAGMDSAQVVARFEAERQALALMDHPHIAKVLDAGRTAAGRPYFVMEHVEGEPITAYCDRHRLPLPERLELFLQACAAIQHAHHKAVVHRDLKPSNILVSTVDGAPHVQIIDFGIAKALEPSATERAVLTELGVLIGTPEYMSPEQAEMGAVDVDTRTDVYSLGVVLYELLTGTLPFDSRDLRSAGFDELRRRIREDEPQKPSTRVSALGERSTEPAALRRSEPRPWSRSLRGDLDWIVMRSLEKDRARRYDSPVALADDLRRHLRREPVLAGPPSAAYRAGRFVRRHRFGVAAAIVAVAVLAGFAVTSRVQSRRLARERDAAERGRRASEEAAVFLSTLLDTANPVLPGGGARSIDEVLDATRARFLATESTPAGAEVRARVADRLGSALHQRGRLAEAREVLESGLAQARRDLGENHRVTLRVANQLAFLCTRLGLCDEAEWLQRDVLARQRAALGPDDPETLWSLSNLGWAYRAQGRASDAEPFVREVLEQRTRVLGAKDRETLRTRVGLAFVSHNLGRTAEAEREVREVLALAHGEIGAEDVDTLDWGWARALLLSELGRHVEADALATRVHEAAVSRLGGGHPTTILAASQVGVIRTRLGRYASAEAILHRALESDTDAVADPARIEPVLSALVDLHAAWGGSPRAASDLRRALVVASERAARCRTDAAAANGLAWLLATARDAAVRDPSRAIVEAERANSLTRGTSPNVLETLAVARAAAGDVEGAVSAARSALTLLGSEPSWLRTTLEARVRAWTSSKRGAG